MSNVQSLNMADFSEKVLKSSVPVILDFGAEWCSPCKRLAPILESLAAEWGQKVTIYSVDADSNSGLVMQFGVMSLPTLVLIKNGKEVTRTVGLQSKEKLIDFVTPHI